MALYGVAPLYRLCLRVATFSARQIVLLFDCFLLTFRESAGPFKMASISPMVRRILQIIGHVWAMVLRTLMLSAAHAACLPVALVAARAASFTAGRIVLRMCSCALLTPFPASCFCGSFAFPEFPLTLVCAAFLKLSWSLCLISSEYACALL